MTSILIVGASRAFGAVRAVDGVDLEVGEGEFFTLLGPSGCGKTTLLRMIAGFGELDRGEIRFGTERIDRLPPHRRDIGMVFQNYAVFPNLTVAGNVAYGLKARRVAAGEVARRVEGALALVRLEGLGGRWPHELSGGQLQRVAIARALVIRPRVLLFDEPLSNLDARLRVSMRGEIRDLQQSLGITAIYVTHDQEEAMAVSDRIAVMNAGRLEQVGTPSEIYRRPATRFAAEFMGTTNLLPQGALRPEALVPAAGAPADWPRLAGTVTRLEMLGPLTRIELGLADGTMVRAALLDDPGRALGVGDALALAYDPARVVALP